MTVFRLNASKIFGVRAPSDRMGELSGIATDTLTLLYIFTTQYTAMLARSWES